MNVELNGTKPFLQFNDLLFLFLHVILKVVIVLLHFFSKVSLEGRVVMASFFPPIP